MRSHPQNNCDLLIPAIASKSRIVRVERVEIENPDIRSFTFRDEACSRASPGQFVMVWIPGVDEVPMSLSMMDSIGRSTITVKKVGEASANLHSLKIGDAFGVRGPYGRGFTPTTGNVLIVGGGIGMAPLAPLTESLAKIRTKITVVVGAATRDELLFLDRIRLRLLRTDAKIVATTEDGSYGWRGLATEAAEQTLARREIDMIYTCGPEKMMQKMFLLAEQHNIPLQASLERVMRCAIGLCGSCVISGLRVCRDGPVVTSEQLREVKDEFGRFKRDLSGRRVRI